MNNSEFISQIVSSFEKMDYSFFEKTLDKEKTYQGFSQPEFLKKLKKHFDQFNRYGNTRLKSYSATCSIQDVDSFPFLFIGSNSSNFNAFSFKIEDNILVDIQECIEFQSERKSLKIKDRILLDDWMNEIQDEAKNDSHKTMEILRGNNIPKYIMKRKDLSNYLRQFKDKFDNIDFNDLEKLAKDFPNSNEEIDEENFAIFHRKYTLFKSFYKIMTQKNMFIKLILEISDLIKSNNKSGALNWYHINKNLFDDLEIGKFMLLTIDDDCPYEQIYRDFWVLKKDIIHIAKLVTVENIFQLELFPLEGEKQNFMAEMRSALRISSYK